MKWRESKTEKYSRIEKYIGQSNNISFECISRLDGGWYCMVEHLQLDKTYNSLWNKESFKLLEEAKQWCENFKFENYKWAGSGENIIEN